ncbi:uncharacterized protein H6S33_001746 [Morchella sextelata]|uniref:uncharacterized protein n=1 Tax=Morchella sextelata TaxID=1174677 RepID=UPI001D0551AE|nr:uncharacterized protein H6S33_001746 [Morchella sextelata]KAH0608612.1 hypothetical protein H6S33_001746 [Morchella sextelata]
MEYRHLGRTGLKVSVISLGGWVTYGGHVGNELAEQCMKAAYDAGINFFDTAEAYARGDSERVMGEVIKKFQWPRCDLVISTKINWGSHNASSTEKAQNCVGLSRKHVVEGLKASLERLQLEYVDVVYAHRPDRDTPMEEVVRGFNHVIERGWAFYWGTSEWTAEEIADAWRIADKLNMIGPVVEQPQYNLLTRDKVEKQFAPLYEKHGLGITCFSPLKIGVLTGKYNEFKIPEGSRLATATDPFTSSVRAKFDSDEEIKKNIQAARDLKPIADELGITQGQLALAWVIKNPRLSSAIIGASKPEQITENVEALKHLDKLTPEIMERIEAVVNNKPVLEPRRFS